jgi:two-component sensor histidine kinase
MAVAEILANAVEHGLRERAGTVALRASRTGQDLQVVVEDDGWGIPEGLDPHTGDRLGLRIVSALVADRGGSLELELRRDADGQPVGTSAAIRVPLPVTT